jgi:fumarylacetoacetase
LIHKLNHTHDPGLRSWVSSANRQGTDFPIQNLPFGIFRRRGTEESFRGGVAIGDQVLDLALLTEIGLLRGAAAHAIPLAAQSTLNAFMALGPSAWSTTRRALSEALQAGAEAATLLARCLVPQDQAEYALPVRVGDYTDFYTSIYHATAVGRMFRPDNPLLPNYHWVPIGYHGRSSSLNISGQTFARPHGQTMPPGATAPNVGPSKRLDCELELGIYVGRGNAQGTRIEMADAESHIFGLCVLNDWSARDFQAWEYKPLGPFLSKNFATTLSPWIVTLEALAPFRGPLQRPKDAPAPLHYLDSPANQAHGAIDIELDLQIQTADMRNKGITPQRLSKTSYRHAYWSAAQLLCHHTINGCNLQVGDLLGTGTQSGPTLAEAGSLLELTSGGRQPVKVGENETRTFFEDGDIAIMHAWCERADRRLGFGEVRAEILPALEMLRDL